MTTHDLKTWPVFFKALADEKKTFEIRKNDRNFALGDFLCCREFEPVRGRYTDARPLSFRITYVLHGPCFGLVAGWVILGLRRIHDEPAAPAAPVPAPAPERPDHAVTCTVIECAPVYQVVEDDRGERHRLTGEEMNEAATEGAAAELWLWHSGRRRLFL